MATDAPPVVELTGITKYYGATRALRGVDLTVNPREVVGLVGDNGSGKSTLVKIITGYHAPTSGRIRFFGEDVRLRSPAQARRLGVECVYQDLALIDEPSLWRHFFLGRELSVRVRPGRQLQRRPVKHCGARGRDKPGPWPA